MGLQTLITCSYYYWVEDKVINRSDTIGPKTSISSVTTWPAWDSLPSWVSSRLLSGITTWVQCTCMQCRRRCPDWRSPNPRLIAVCSVVIVRIVALSTDTQIPKILSKVETLEGIRKYRIHQLHQLHLYVSRTFLQELSIHLGKLAWLATLPTWYIFPFFKYLSTFNLPDYPYPLLAWTSF